MPELETRFRGLDRVRGPDLWPDIETREPRPMPEGSTARRVVAGAVALVLAAGGAVLVARAFLGGDRTVERPVRPAESPPAPVDPVVDVTLPIEWPSSIVYGEGSVWVAAWVEETDGNLLYRVHPDTGEIQAEIPVPSIPGWETGGGGMVAANGSVWIAGITEQEDQGALLRIDATTNEVADIVPLGGDFGGDVAVDQRGIWVSLFAEPSVQLLRLDPETLSVEIRTDLGSDWVREILAVDGTVWVRAVGEGDELVGDRKRLLLRIDPETGEIIQRVEAPGAVTAVTGGAGAVWATSWKPSYGNSLARLDPKTGDVVLLPSETLDFLVEVGEGGLWGRGIDETTGRMGIVRYDPEAGQIDASVELGQQQNPIDLAIAPGSIWVATYEEGVTRVELRPA
jgi:hypothetical protein